MKTCPIDDSALRKAKYEFISIWQCPECFGTEQGRHYTSYSQLTQQERREYIRTLASSTPDRAQAFFSVAAQAIGEAIANTCRNHWLTGRGLRL
jgi:Zn-finger nucleic acid-binding protein